MAKVDILMGRQLLPALCFSCKHLVPREETFLNTAECPAFPNGIPKNVMYGKPPWHVPDHHFNKLPGQTGDTVFEPMDGDEGLREQWIESWIDLKGVEATNGQSAEELDPDYLP